MLTKTQWCLSIYRHTYSLSDCLFHVNTLYFNGSVGCAGEILELMFSFSLSLDRYAAPWSFWPQLVHTAEQIYG